MTQGGPWGDPFAPQQQAPAPVAPPPPGEHNTLSTLSVVFAFVFAPVGAILGHVGLTQTQRTGQRGRERALIGLTLSYTFITAAVIALVVWVAVREPDSASTTVAAPSTTTAAATTSTRVPPPPPPAPRRVEEAGMAGLLPSLDEMRQLMNNPTLVDSGTGDEVALVSPDVQTFDPVECASSMNSFTPRAYQDTGYRAVYSVNQHQQPVADMQAGEGVAIFDDAAAAQKALTHYVALWQECAGKHLTWAFVQDGRSAPFILGAPESSGGVIGLRTSNPGSNILMLRAIGAKSNVLVDVQMLGAGLTDHHITAVQRILDRIPG